MSYEIASHQSRPAGLSVGRFYRMICPGVDRDLVRLKIGSFRVAVGVGVGLYALEYAAGVGVGIYFGLGVNLGVAVLRGVAVGCDFPVGRSGEGTNGGGTYGTVG